MLVVSSAGVSAKALVDPTMGFISVPVDWSADRVRMVLHSKGQQAVFAVRSFKVCPHVSQLQCRLSRSALLHLLHPLLERT